MQRSLRLSLTLSGVAALVLANGALLPAAAQETGGGDITQTPYHCQHCGGVHLAAARAN